MCLELKYSNFKMIASNVMLQLKKLERHIPALAIASAINKRLTDLLSSARFIDSLAVTGNNQRYLMFSEAARRETFSQWPHMDYQWAKPDQMAQAGFYHNPNDSGDDRAMCFTCNVCLVSWEKNDEPWCEHERHSPNCPFVKGEYTQNVPLSVTYATSPAIECQPFDIISKGEDGIILCTADSKTALFKVWSIERTLSLRFSYNVANEESLLKSNSLCDDPDRYTFNIRLTALATYAQKKAPVLGQLLNKQVATWNAENLIETRICCGTTAKFSEIQQIINENVMNIENQANSEQFGIKISPETTSTDAAEPKQSCEAEKNEVFLVVYKIVSDNVKKSMSKSVSSTTSDLTTSKDIEIDEMNLENLKKKLHNINNEEEYREMCLMEISEMNMVEGNQAVMKTNKKVSNVGKSSNNKANKIEKIVLNGITEEPEEQEIILAPLKKYPAVNYNDLENKYSLAGGFGSLSSQTGLVDSPIQISQLNNAAKENIKNQGTEFTCVPVQAISLGSIAPDSYEIVDIIPSHDQQYLLVVLKKERLEIEAKDQQEGAMDVDEEDATSSCPTQLVLFKVDEEGKLESQPQCVQILFEDHSPISICMLPGYENDPKRSNADTKDGVFAMTCADGILKLVSLKTLRTISEASIEGEKFVAATYCKSLDRMCGCTENGSLHFYSFYDNDGESGDEHDDHNNLLIISDSSISDDEIKNCGVGEEPAKKDTSKRHMFGSPSGGNLPNFIAYKPELGIEDLKVAYQLTQFEKVLTPYSAEVPVCWNESVVQKVRRHPPNLKPGDDIHLSKTWRLHRDA